MSKKFIFIFLILIIIVGGILRLWQLGQIPPSPDWDEVALGYDGYSLIQTGRDEYGKFLPVVLRSFDDYKPALYAYLTIPTILTFGLNVFAVRFPSAIFGILSIIAVSFLIRELFERYKHRDILSLLSAFLFAISPWSIQFSRVGFESNVGVAFNIFTALFFLKGLKKPWLLSVAAFFAGLNLYVYQSEKVFTPILAIMLIIIFRKELFSKAKKYLLLAFVIGVIVVLPMVIYTATDKSSLLRVKGTSIFSYQTELLKRDIQKLEQDIQNNDRLGLILDNRRVVYAKTIIDGYLSHFNLNWLFITGDISRHHAPNMGILYLFEFPFILLGIYYLLFGDFSKKTKFLIFGWFLLAPLPASITTGVPHAVRTLNFLPTWQIFAALGIISSIVFVRRFKFLKILAVLYLLFALLNIFYYLNQYFVQLSYYDSADWQYGYKQAVDEAKSLEGKYKEIVVSDDQPMDKSYMFFLFYLKYPPADYQKIGETSSGGFASHHSFGKYTFRPINWNKDSLEKDILFIGTPKEIPAGVNTIKTIYNLDGKEAIKIVGT
ncbi:MAG: hypothetical protein A2W22_06265 [Candidatus Levybacteria bacterium RBG_16_35_11]|nr:MAG: hypothetical protein A2W22_06265 [Candidatus Levybacteria bacterium RBG_16_35_11]